MELDSICDVVSFGVAPGFLMYHFALHELQIVGILLAALAPLCGAVRLARFNVEARSEPADYFRRLPIPAYAIMLASFYLTFRNRLDLVEVMNQEVITVLIPVMLILSFLMLSSTAF